jgi:ribosome recycling factor
LQLNIPVPPPTAESRAQALTDAKRETEKAGLGIRDARGAWQKWYRKADKEKLVIRDELEKAHKKMEGVVERGHKTVKEVYDQAVKNMER